MHKKSLRALLSCVLVLLFYSCDRDSLNTYDGTDDLIEENYHLAAHDINDFPMTMDNFDSLSNEQSETVVSEEHLSVGIIRDSGYATIVQGGSIWIRISKSPDVDYLEFYTVDINDKEEFYARESSPGLSDRFSFIIDDPATNRIRIYGYGSSEENRVMCELRIAVIHVYSKSRDGETHLSANFQVKEFACKDGSDTILIDPRLVNLLQTISEHFEKGINIASGYRTEAFNAKVGGVENSLHTQGRAADIIVSGVQPLQVAEYAESIGIKGIGLYERNGFVHIDTSDHRVFWVGVATGIEWVATFSH